MAEFVLRRKHKALMIHGESRPIPIQVKSHAGYKAEEYPTAFSIGSHTFKIDEIVDRWYGMDHAYFKVRVDDGNLYILRYDQAGDSWELIFMEASALRPKDEG